MLGQRREWQSAPGQPVTVDDEWVDAFVEGLPYPLTNAQTRALHDIRTDIARDIPVNHRTTRRCGFRQDGRGCRRFSNGGTRR